MARLRAFLFLVINCFFCNDTFGQSSTTQSSFMDSYLSALNSYNSLYSSILTSASEDASDTAGSSAQAQAILANSAVLTAKNARCNDLIAEYLQNNTDMKNTQPVVPTNLDLKFILINLNDIDDASGIMSITARIDFRWFDRRLSLPLLNSSTCKGETLLVPTQSVWFPYFIIQNGANDVFYPDAWEKFPSSLRADGYISWRVAFKLDLACDMDFTIFPFDSQYCKVIIQSPHYGEGELNYTVSDISRGVVVFDASSADHPMWQLEGQAVRYTNKVPGIVFWIALKRKCIYYIWTIAIPVLAVCVLTASTFVIPADGEEKMSTVINGLLSFFLLYLLFVTAIPQTSTNIPFLMIFFSVQIILTTVQVIMCGAILRLFGLEEAEEELAEQEEDENSGEHATRRPLTVSGDKHFHPHNAHSARYRHHHHHHHHLHHSVNSVSPDVAAEKINVDVEHSTDSILPSAKKAGAKKKRLISAKWLNEITLAVYLFCVVVTVIGFVGAMVQVYKTASPAVAYSAIMDYQVGE